MERYPEFEVMRGLCGERMSPRHHGDTSRWLDALNSLPDVRPSRVLLGPTVTIGSGNDLGDDQRDVLETSLRALHPWRKGPFEFFGIRVDSEWRSDCKWARLWAALGDLAGARILDVGAGNGYYGWRMLDAGAECVVGVDPTIVYNMQHRAVCAYLSDLAPRNVLLPLRLEELPPGPRFDIVFSMGVIYHRRRPREHIERLRARVESGGCAVIETLIVGPEHSPWLEPRGRYARMRNVGRIPTLDTLRAWLAEAGFDPPQVVSVERTTPAEQRSTEWMRFESLAAALDPADPEHTIEGHPAPVRAVLTARLR